MSKYIQHYNALFDDGYIRSTAPNKKKKRINWEEIEQVKLASWLTKACIPFYHSANGGSRHPLEAIKFKRMGVQAGTPDLCIPVSRKSYHGLYIELKRVGGGVLSLEQKYWLDLLNKQGYLAVVAHGFEEAKKIVIDYINI